MAVDANCRRAGHRCAAVTMRAIVAALLVSLALATAGVAGERKELADEELDLVSAGSATVGSIDELAAFSATKTTRLGKIITVDGSIALVDAIDRATIGTLTLTDGAQSHLQSLININAVNSSVNVLLNLNINIDSSVGSLNQFNVNGIIPSLVDTPGG